MDGEEFLFSLSRFGIKLGLGPTAEFARMLGNPHESFRSIHVAGSNGKGSTATFLYRIFKRKYVTGLYTSPHLRRFTERIIVNDNEMPLDYLEKFVEQHNSIIDYNGEKTQLTFFEYTTNMAFDYFRKMGVEFASVEVGLGGRLDSTNIIEPEASVITSISLEHTDKLGGSIDAIAREKGGIIKKGKPVILGRVPEVAGEVLHRIANERGSSVREVEDCKVSNLRLSLSGTEFSLDTEAGKYEVNLKALGEHQVANSVAAILASESVSGAPAREDTLAGLSEAPIAGRFEIRRRKPLLILDGAHNSEASRILSSNIARYGIKDPLIVLGVLKDKNSYNILQNLSEVSNSVLITEPNELERKKDSAELMKEAKLFFDEVKIRKRPSDALIEAIKSERNTVITGSLYLIGEMENIIDAMEGQKSVPVESEGYDEKQGLIE
jgi:dihydrofolate synthase/folylpolyglutamate synthase